MKVLLVFFKYEQLLLRLLRPLNGKFGKYTTQTYMCKDVQHAAGEARYAHKNLKNVCQTLA